MSSGGPQCNPDFSALGVYHELDYTTNGNANDYHYVEITNPSCDGENFEWSNQAGVSWSLHAQYENGQITHFNVGDDCPYFDGGHTAA